METLFLLVRHAETNDNVELRLSGWTDTGLSPRGEAQVTLLADHFNRAHPDTDALYASPLIRTRRTAEAIGALTGHVPAFVDDLREMHFGDIEGMRFDQIQRDHGHLLAAELDPALNDFAWPGGESRLEFGERVRGVLDRIARRHPAGTVAVVTHGGVIAYFMTILHGEPVYRWRDWVVPNASLTEVAWDPDAGRGRVLRHGDAAHLAELEIAEAPRSEA